MKIHPFIETSDSIPAHMEALHLFRLVVFMNSSD